MPLLTGKPIALGLKQSDAHLTPPYLQGRLDERPCAGCGTGVLFTVNLLMQIDAGQAQPACKTCTERHDQRGRRAG